MSSSISASTQQVSEWLSSFGAALDRADYDAALQMFEEESYWRDLVALTWNIKTLEGKESILWSRKGKAKTQAQAWVGWNYPRRCSPRRAMAESRTITIKERKN